MDISVVLIVVVVLVALLLVAAGILLARRRRSKRLQEHYGPEYDRLVADTGDRRAAEARLAEREARHRDLDVRELHADERERFAVAWAGIQRGFVDDPVRAVRDADGLVVDILRTRGYPVDDDERRAEDVSVEHPGVVHQYREARAIREATERGGADTEEQRRAVTSYRALVEALLGQEQLRAQLPGSGSDRAEQAVSDPTGPHGAHRNGNRPTEVPTTEEQTR